MNKLASLSLALLIAVSGAAFAQSSANAPKAPTAKAEAPKSEAPKSDAAKPAEAKKELMDINSASEKDLATLPKIGEARAKAIIKSRPYSGKDELLKKKIIPKDAYEAIKDLVIAKQGSREEKKDMKKEEKKK